MENGSSQQHQDESKESSDTPAERSRPYSATGLGLSAHDLPLAPKQAISHVG